MWMNWEMYAGSNERVNEHKDGVKQSEYVRERMKESQTMTNYIRALS